MKSDPTFWTRMAEKYRARPISDETAYQQTLDRVAAHIGAGDRVLELGCGTGGTAELLAPQVAHYTATDFSEGMIAQAKARPDLDNLEFAVTDVFDAQFMPASFDAVLAFNLFHLVEDPIAHFERIHGLLKPGGIFISKTPCLTDHSAAVQWKLIVRIILPVLQLLGKAPFVRFRTIAQWQEMIRAAGFEIVETGDYPKQPPSHFIVARKT